MIQELERLAIAQACDAPEPLLARLPMLIDELEAGNLPPVHTGVVTRCFNWTGYTNKNGYGYVTVTWHGRRSMPVHKIFYLTLVGPIPRGRSNGQQMRVHHKCENRRCCRPDHLELLTLSDHTARHNRNKKGTKLSKEAKVNRMAARGVKVYFDPSRTEPLAKKAKKISTHAEPPVS